MVNMRVVDQILAGYTALSVLSVSIALRTELESGSLHDIIYAVTGSTFKQMILANQALNIVIISAKAVQLAIFGRLRVVERKVKNQTMRSWKRHWS